MLYRILLFLIIPLTFGNALSAQPGLPQTESTGESANGKPIGLWTHKEVNSGWSVEETYDSSGVRHGGYKVNYGDGTYVVGQYNQGYMTGVWKARFAIPMLTAYLRAIDDSIKGNTPDKLIKSRALMYWHTDNYQNNQPFKSFSYYNDFSPSGFYLTSAEDEVNPTHRIEIFWNRLHPNGNKAEEWIKVKPAVFLHTYMFTRWYADGRIEMQLLYDSDFELHGPCRYFEKNGKLHTTRYFEHGVESKYIIW